MTIGRNSRKASVRSSIRAPKYLDKASGFYCRLDEPETLDDVRKKTTEDDNREDESVMSPTSGADQREAHDFSEGIMEDDGETLLQRKPSRHSSRWRRSSRRKQKERKGEDGLEKENPADLHSAGNDRVRIEADMDKLRKIEGENEKAGKGREPPLVHFPAREEADDQVLIRDKKSGREEEGNLRTEQEKRMKVAKRNTMKSYGKAMDRALRRGWEAFITNLYSVTLTPVTPSSEKKNLHKSVLAEFR